MKDARTKSRRQKAVASHALVWRFGLKFGTLMLLYYLAALTPFCDRLLQANLAANAWLANGILDRLGQETQVAETTIRSARFAIAVRRGCDAIEPAWFFGAALLSFPAPWRRKLSGLGAGVLLLQLLNLVRIVSLYFIGLHCPKLFPAAHGEIWPVVFILAALALWLGWIGWSRRATPAVSHAAA